MAKIVDKLNFNNEEYRIQDTTAIVSNSSVTFKDSDGKFISLKRNVDGSFELAQTTYTKPAWASATLKIGTYDQGSYEYDTNISGNVTITATTNNQPVTGIPTMSLTGVTISVEGSAPTFTGTGTLSTKIANGSSLRATIGSLSGTVQNPSTNNVESTGTKYTGYISVNKVAIGYMVSTDGNATFNSNTSGGFSIPNMTKGSSLYTTSKNTFNYTFENVDSGNYVYIALPQSWGIESSNLYPGDTAESAAAQLISGGWKKVGETSTYSTNVLYDIWRTDGNSWNGTCGISVR